MATSEFKKLAPEKIETEAAAQVAKEEKFIIDFVKDSYDLYLNDARLNPARNLEITKNQDKAITLFEEYEFEEKAKESERKTDQLNEIFDLESEIERMLSPVISSEIKMPKKEESKLVPRTSGKILDVRYKVPVVKGTVLEVKLIDKKETVIIEPEEDLIIEEIEEVDDDYLDDFLKEIKRTIEIKETFQEEALLVFNKLDKILNEAGSSKNNVLQIRIYLSNIDLWPTLNELYANFFADHKPARIVIPSPALHYNCSIEIEATAFV